MMKEMAISLGIENHEKLAAMLIKEIQIQGYTVQIKQQNKLLYYKFFERKYIECSLSYNYIYLIMHIYQINTAIKFPITKSPSDGIKNLPYTVKIFQLPLRTAANKHDC
ncbi:hypothetical protein TTHERM_000125279 (macronuclear) [Tetrahymena thermophila SB210]|uniref:Uncharacterized protein n=1 Tax=Tetrahymena thermophila (strain SB210) TaxID=312017 RepID=W7XJU8_TETTS|nr:hypothetical protein TTHERM_000125279 [Tetrahymena thermophila SB210]EWS74344.1 hypothetical protein TTHERM_000125279 [Tetrahymena thermophila SB210]|eukprot:XP_012653165.1 hypothetical protein TTHERM_000125279 [Tetrahymena thermophila SB210]